MGKISVFVKEFPYNKLGTYILIKKQILISNILNMKKRRRFRNLFKCYRIDQNVNFPL